MSQQVKQAPNAPIDLRAYHPLARLRRIIRAYVLLEGVLLALILGCIWYWFSTGLDFSLQYLFGIDLLDSARPVRWVLSVLFVAAMGAIVIWYIFRRLFRDFSAASLALVLEKRFPELLGDRLITAVELYDLKRAEKQGYSVEMIVKTMKDAKERVDQIPIRSVFNWPRLALLAWILVGVSAFLLLLTYPIVVLCTLVGQQRGPALWAMLTVNALLVLSLAFVFVVPFLYARMRKASSKLRWALVGIAVVCATTTVVGYDYALKQVNSIQMHEYSWRLNHVADISLDRNFRFMETRWPKDEHFVEWLDFPVDSKRVQLNKTINARAYVVTWIIADDAAPKRWRPVKWSDLPKLVGPDQIPDLPIDKIRAYLVAITDGDERSPVGYDKTKLKLPSKDDVNVDLVMAVVNDVDSPATRFTAAERQPFATLAAKLNALAADPKLGGRTIRKIGAAESMTLVYGSAESKQKGRSKLAVLDERRNVYGLEQPVQLGDNFAADGEAIDDTGAKIKERRVALVAEAEIDGKPAATITKSVALVRPPKLDMLRYQEATPAYLWYLPPSGPRASSIDERRRLMRDRDLRQTMPEISTQLPPDSVTIPLFRGSELTYTAISDKKLQEVTLTARNPDFPGCTSKKDMFPVHLNIAPDGRTFTIKFAANGRPLRDWHQIDEAPTPSGTASPKQNPVFPLIAKSMTFDVAMKDRDNMTSTRTFTVRPIEDKLPNVNVYVDVIRQVQVNDRTVYMCTAKAEIPFTKESNVADDNGLHKVEFSYEYMPLANSAVVGVRAELAAWLLASTPVLPNIGDYLYRREVLQRTISTGKNPGAIKGTVPIDSFANAQGRKDNTNILTIDQLKPKLAELLPERYESPVLKKYEFRGDEQVVFDLQSRLPRLGEKDGNGIVPIYELVLNVRATDSNVLADFDRFSENRDAPLVFRIVSQEELYAHIAREESELVRRFDEMIGKLVANKQILEGSFARAANLSPSTAASEQTRVEGVMDVVSLSREQTAEIYSAYSRIQREYEANRAVKSLTDRLNKQIIAPLEAVQRLEFSQAKKDLELYHVALKDGQPGRAQPQVSPTLKAVNELIEALLRIRKEMGDSIDYNKAVQKLQALIADQTKWNKIDLAKAIDDYRGDLLEIKFKDAPSAIMVNAGQTTKATLKLRMPDTIVTDPILRFEIPANSGLKITPGTLKLDDDAKEAVFDITAGKATGIFFLKINPSQGKPFELKVIVR